MSKIYSKKIRPVRREEREVDGKPASRKTGA